VAAGGGLLGRRLWRDDDLIGVGGLGRSTPGFDRRVLITSSRELSGLGANSPRPESTDKDEEDKEGEIEVGGRNGARNGDT